MTTKNFTFSSRKRYVAPAMEVCQFETEDMIAATGWGENMNPDGPEPWPGSGAKQARFEHEMVWDEMDYEDMEK